MVEVLKHSSHLGKKVVCIVNNGLVDLIVDKWKESQMDLKTLKSQITLPTNNDPTFIEYIENLVLLDLIMDDFIDSNFVKLKSFPYLGENL